MVASPKFGFNRKQFQLLWSVNDSFIYLVMRTGSSAITFKATCDSLFITLVYSVLNGPAAISGTVRVL